MENENINKIREIKHNLKNMLIVIKELMNNNKIEEANNIIDKIINNIDSITSGKYTNNITINSIINSKIAEARRYKIFWKIDVIVSENINIDDDDLGIILGNLLDNAIEACSFLKNKAYINVKIYEKENSIIICIKNSKRNMKVSGGTWKSDKADHGIGLKSVNKLVSKYNGAIMNKDEENYYESNIILWD